MHCRLRRASRGGGSSLLTAPLRGEIRGESHSPVSRVIVMSPTSRARLLDVCQQEVTGFRCGDYALAYDLDWLDRLHRQESVEGVILHASRILEVLSRQALGLAGNPDNKLLEIINDLQHYLQIPGRLRNCLHQLRRLGNDARHALRPLSREEAELAYVIILHWLAWFFCDYQGGLKLRCLLIHNQAMETLLPAWLAGLMKQLDDDNLAAPHFVDAHFVASLRLSAPDCPVLLSPVLPALLVEGLL